MGNEKADTREKIILPKNTQREMIKFFLKTSMPKIAELDKERQQAPDNSNKGR